MNNIKSKIIWLLRIRDYHYRIKLISEKLRRLDFLTIVQSEEMGLDPEKYYRCSPSGNKYLRNVLKSIKISPDDSIIDIGCGKGSALKLMLEFPFSRIDGIEISGQVARVATNNFKKLREERVKIFNENAIDFNQYSRYNIFYFYNPFSCQIMSEVIKKITDSNKNSNKEIKIIYTNPKCHDSIVSHGFYLLKEFPGECNNECGNIHLYSNKINA